MLNRPFFKMLVLTLCTGIPACVAGLNEGAVAQVADGAFFDPTIDCTGASCPALPASCSGPW